MTTKPDAVEEVKPDLRETLHSIMDESRRGLYYDVSPEEAGVLLAAFYRFVSACATEEGPNHLDMADAQKLIEELPW